MAFDIYMLRYYCLSSYKNKYTHPYDATLRGLMYVESVSLDTYDGSNSLGTLSLNYLSNHSGCSPLRSSSSHLCQFSS